MKFSPAETSRFLDVFYQSRPVILSGFGCSRLELFRLPDDPDTVITLSEWESTGHLNRYRESEFFTETWKTIRPWMVEAPIAESWNPADQP
ncbi:MAG: antibiotic biosynthesis monooxygenase [Bacteroidetes bacterium]|nr:antibiotic biosynthesis monooxygenase [Bacteroidota bacterium]